MDTTTYTTAGREWEAGERVIIVSTDRNTAAPRVSKIESVAPKSFVVNGERFSREKLFKGLPQKGMGSGWGVYHLTVYPFDHPKAPLLLAERATYKQGRLVDAAQREHVKRGTAHTADVLRGELSEWIEARKTFDRERSTWEQREHDGW